MKNTFLFGLPLVGLLLLGMVAQPLFKNNWRPTDHLSALSAGVFAGENGSVSFKSDAPLEVIQAESKSLRGVIDPEKQSFAWSVEVNSFEGFNNPLQREHFNENYLESKKYPKAIFTGKIIEAVDFDKNGVYEVRAKGKLNIHGKEEERIIKGQLQVEGNKIHIQTTFSVLLSDHDIRIPKIVYQKIAEEVHVRVDAVLIRK